MLKPWVMARNPVMFITEIGAALTTLVLVTDLFANRETLAYTLAVTVILWLTVLFANFAEALAEARGKAQADTLKRTRRSTLARRVVNGGEEQVSSDELREGDVVLVAAGEIIPSDGEVIEGAATVDESAITGESAPVVREAGGDRSGVTGGTRVLSDQIRIRITAGAGESFLDRMIALVEGAVRQKTPNELALTVTLAGLTLAFLMVTGALWPIGRYFGVDLPIPTLIALLVCLIPTTIGALLAAIGLAGMDRALSANVLAKSGKAVELAGDIDTLLLDKTGTITMGDRQATAYHPLAGRDRRAACRGGHVRLVRGPDARGEIHRASRRKDPWTGGAPRNPAGQGHSLYRPNPIERPRSPGRQLLPQRGIRRDAGLRPGTGRPHPRCPAGAGGRASPVRAARR